ncbi:hypothetical protein CF319_g7581 [Tilletia indica]|nr:hypothetical protein CF319_g7581 [Tilletia indica]KAE8219153.1 hypothetical protein CF326_g9015 [Tilletia indica]
MNQDAHRKLGERRRQEQQIVVDLQACTCSISKQATPGNLQGIEDLLFVNTDILGAPIVMALKIRMKDGVKHVGAAYADASSRMICSATRK